LFEGKWEMVGKGGKWKRWEKVGKGGNAAKVRVTRKCEHNATPLRS